MKRCNVFLSAIFIIFISALSACGGDSQPECAGDSCGLDCPDTFSYKSAQMAADGESCSVPEGIDSVASSLFNEMLTVIPGTYKNEDNGDTVTVTCDAEGTLWFPDGETPPCECAVWVMPFIFVFENETFHGGLENICSDQFAGMIFKGEGDPTDASNTNAIGDLRYDDNDGEWYLDLENEDGVPVAWRKI